MDAGELPGTIEELAIKTARSTLLFRRWLGCWIDFVVVASFLLIPDYFLGNELYQKTIAIWLLLVVLYFPLFEGLTGRTVGKAIVGTRVVDASGRPPGIWRACVRTLTRILEVNPLIAGGIPAGLFVAFSKTKQRLGDAMAGTYVVLMEDVTRRKYWRVPTNRLSDN